MRRSAEVESAHHMPVRDVDFARGQAHLLLSAGDDCRLRLWDLRCGCGLSLHRRWGLGYFTLQSELVWQAHWVLFIAVYSALGYAVATCCRYSRRGGFQHCDSSLDPDSTILMRTGAGRARARSVAGRNREPE